MMDKEQLLKFGLSKREADAYYYLLKVNESSASELSVQTSESRTNTYDTINTLIKKGLVNYVIKNNQKFFKSTPPNRLLDWINLQMDKLEKQKKEAEVLIPQLSKLRMGETEKISVEVYEGKEGFRSMLKEIVESSKITQKEVLIFGGIAGGLKQFDPVYHERYYNERKKYKIKFRYIYVEGEKHLQGPYSEHRFLPIQYKNFVSTAVHGDEVSLWPLNPTKAIILIRSKNLADSYRKNFEILWHTAKK